MTFFLRPWFWVSAVVAMLWSAVWLSALCDSSIGYQVVFALFLK